MAWSRLRVGGKREEARRTRQNAAIGRPVADEQTDRGGRWDWRTNNVYAALRTLTVTECLG